MTLNISITILNSKEINIDKSNENDVKFKIDNKVKENGTNSEILGKETISTISGSKDNVREQSSNTEKLKGCMGVLRTSNKDNQNIFAGQNGWLSKTIREKFSVDNFHKLIASLRGNVQGRQIL